MFRYAGIEYGYVQFLSSTPPPPQPAANDANARGFLVVNVGAVIKSLGSARLARLPGPTRHQTPVAMSRAVVIRVSQLQTGPSAEVAA